MANPLHYYPKIGFRSALEGDLAHPLQRLAPDLALEGGLANSLYYYPKIGFRSGFGRVLGNTPSKISSSSGFGRGLGRPPSLLPKDWLQIWLRKGAWPTPPQVPKDSPQIWLWKPWPTPFTITQRLTPYLALVGGMADPLHYLPNSHSFTTHSRAGLSTQGA